MIGIYIRAGVVCPACDSLVPINAMVSRFRCAACGESIRLEGDDWSSTLGDILQQAPSMEEGDASRSSILGSHRLQVTRGRLAPRYRCSDRPVDLELLTGLKKRITLEPPGEGQPTVARPVPEPLAHLLPGVVALVAEDPALLDDATDGNDLKIEESSTPVAFNCPSCGGYLVTEGSSRKATCRYCGETAMIPERLWQRVHPSVKMSPWFLVLDAEPVATYWGGDAYSAAADGAGGAVIAAADGEGPPMLLCLEKDWQLKWSRRVFSDPLSEEGNPRLALSPDGPIVVWRANAPEMHLLSPADGTTLEVLRGAEPESSSDWSGFTMLGCLGLAVFPDSMVLCSGPWRDRNGRKQFRLLRFSLRGEPRPLWAERADRGIIRRLLDFRGKKKLTWFAGCADSPVAFRDGVRLAAGPDGSLFMLQRNLLAKFSPSGQKLFMVALPDGYSESDPVADAQGRCWVIIKGATHETALFRVSPDGREVLEAAHTDDSDHPLYFASAAAAVREGILTAGWSGGLFIHKVRGTLS